MAFSSTSLTIAIPSYNRARKVRALALSVLTQMQPGDELLVVDDGSPDDTADVLSAVPGVRLHRQVPNQGMVKTWNACLREASNDWVCIVHDDDLLADGALEAIRTACATVAEPALIIHTPFVKTKPDRFTYSLYSPGPSAVFASATGTMPSGAVVHREIVKALGGFDEALPYSPDLEYFARINAHYKLFVIDSPAIVHYQLHADNFQYKTWLKPDFFPQLLEVEKKIIDYAELTGTEAADRLRDRTIAYLIYITDQAEQLGNRALMRKYGLLLWKTQGGGRGRQLRGLLLALRSWLPYPSKPHK